MGSENAADMGEFKLRLPTFRARRHLTLTVAPRRVPLSVQQRQLEELEKKYTEELLLEAAHERESSESGIFLGENQSETGPVGPSRNLPSTLSDGKLTRSVSSPALIPPRKGQSTSKATLLKPSDARILDVDMTPCSGREVNKQLFPSATKCGDGKENCQSNPEEHKPKPLLVPQAKRPLFRSESVRCPRPYLPRVPVTNKPTMPIKPFHKPVEEPKLQRQQAPKPIQVAGKTFEVKDKIYTSLGLVGTGGSSKVYQVLDMESKALRVIKVVDLEGVDLAVAQGFQNEIDLLLRLQHSNRIVRLFDHEKKPSDLMLLVMERGETDLATLIKRTCKSEGKLEPSMVAYYWSQMLQAVQVIHSEGIIHSDLKPANFLLVEGQLKLIDFGIASAIQADMTSVVKETQMGTFNFMSPEAIQSYYPNGKNRPVIKIGVKSDVWSLGCILYQMVHGELPFQKMASSYQKLEAICDPKHNIRFPQVANEKVTDVLKKCLQRNPRDRASVQDLLNHPYLSSV